ALRRRTARGHSRLPLRGLDGVPLGDDLLDVAGVGEHLLALRAEDVGVASLHLGDEGAGHVVDVPGRIGLLSHAGMNRIWKSRSPSSSRRAVGPWEAGSSITSR